MNRFDIAPFALPNHPAEELRFEETRDVQQVEVVFSGSAPSPATLHLQYMRKVWPETRVEHPGDLDLQRPMNYGWTRLDDLFTPEWMEAAVEMTQINDHTLNFTFQPLTDEISDFPGAQAYDVTYRRTVGLRLVGSQIPVVAMRVFTPSQPARTTLRVELNAGKPAETSQVEVSGYNAVVRSATRLPYTRTSDDCLHIPLVGGANIFELEVDHMLPSHRYAHDDGHLFFAFDHDNAFTISLVSLQAEGPIWYPEAGVFITRADDPETFAQYQARTKDSRTIARRVSGLPEQSLAGARNGQPRPHPIAYCFGCKHARQKFWIDPTGDLQLTAWQVTQQPGRDTPRWKNAGDARLLFGLDTWAVEARHNDPWPVMAYNQQFRRDEIRIHQKGFSVPLTQSILTGEPAPDDTIVALLRFTFENTGDAPALAELPLAYSHQAARSFNRRDELSHRVRRQTDTLVPLCEREPLTVQGDLVFGSFQAESVLRLAFATSMKFENTQGVLKFHRQLLPGESCELLLRVPFVALEFVDEVDALRGLEFERCYAEMAQYWRLESRKGAQIHTPDPHLNAVYAGHLPIILMSDFGHPDSGQHVGLGIVNTSVGSTTYGNFTNESVMIIEELEQRGLVEEVRRRLAVWTHYQGTVGLIGRFSDHDGVFYGADGLEAGQSYNQHHGWVMWYLARHYLHTGDREWFTTVLDNLLRGAEWIIRQRQATLSDPHAALGADLPHSRGWERGFLPAGALEDVDDFFYWLSTNSLTWRGLDAAATALEHYGYPDAVRYRQEADAYRHDLRHGFETARQHSPLIRLRDGRWVPHYPSRLYLRGRDFGWIREVLEGSVYLLISGLYDPQGKEAGWILDDFQDTRYMNPPFGYRLDDPQTQWYDCGGFSAQPNLLAGLLPYLDRDEIEVYLWMFFNAFAACYREEVQAMIEHPQPVLGFNNAAPFKTSDQSNAMKWLAYMFAYQRGGLLHLGRALPRAWFGGGRVFGASRLSLPAGIVSVEYQPHPAEGWIEANVELELRNPPDRLLLRFRTPQKQPIRSVTVNGHPHLNFQTESGDVELLPASGKILVRIDY
jgi:hypothetical protein